MATLCNSWEESPYGAQEEVLRIASKLGIDVSVGLAYQSSVSETGVDKQLKYVDGDVSVYLGAAPIVECLERYKPDVIITSRVADASLFLGPMVFELGWNWDQLQLLAQGSLAGHLLECGCQLTGGYYMHPGDKHRNMSFQNLLDLSLPFAEITSDGKVCVAKAEVSGGILSFSTCTEQLLYEVGDPSAYITPDVIVDVQDVTFQPLSDSKVLCSGAKPSPASIPQKLLLLRSKDTGWKGWGEISYGGCESMQRAKAAEFLAREDIRLRMDGLFEKEEQAIQLTKEFTALYTNGPAGGGGISTGCKKEIFLEKGLVGREYVHWQISAARNNRTSSTNQNMSHVITNQKCFHYGSDSISVPSEESVAPQSHPTAAPAGQTILLYDVAHSRAGDKGNDLNFSIIPHFPPDIERLKMILTPNWVKKVLSPLLNPSAFPDLDDIERRDKWVDDNVKVEIYEVRGVRSLNVVVRNILDGGVNCSRRIDRHGKTISDVILSQQVVLPP